MTDTQLLCLAFCTSYCAADFAIFLYRTFASVRWGSNARLIASAPDMLAALEQITALGGADTGNPSHISMSASGQLECRRIARAAIVKATGGPVRATDAEIKEELRNEIQASGDC